MKPTRVSTTHSAVWTRCNHATRYDLLTVPLFTVHAYTQCDLLTLTMFTVRACTRYDLLTVHLFVVQACTQYALLTMPLFAVRAYTRYFWSCRWSTNWRYFRSCRRSTNWRYFRSSGVGRIEGTPGVAGSMAFISGVSPKVQRTEVALCTRDVNNWFLALTFRHWCHPLLRVVLVFSFVWLFWRDAYSVCSSAVSLVATLVSNGELRSSMLNWGTIPWSACCASHEA